MKTTLNLPDELYRKAKATAALRGESLTSLLAEALEGVIAGRASRGGKKRRVPETPAAHERRIAKWREQETAFIASMRGPNYEGRSSVEIIREGRR